MLIALSCIKSVFLYKICQIKIQDAQLIAWITYSCKPAMYDFSAYFYLSFGNISIIKLSFVKSVGWAGKWSSKNKI